jgi:hypothetical protein
MKVCEPAIKAHTHLHKVLKKKKANIKNTRDKISVIVSASSNTHIQIKICS